MTEFDVLMPVYFGDKPENFESALASIFDNTVLPKNIIVVCDGTLTVDLNSVLEKYSINENLQCIRLPENLGIVGALNAGLHYCVSPFIIRCDADDINELNRFEKLVSILSDGYDLVGSQVLEFDENGPCPTQKSLPLSASEIAQYAKRRNPFNHMSVGMRRDKLIKYGGYPSIHLREDYALWSMFIADKCQMINLPDVLVAARVGEGMIKRRRGISSALAEFQLQNLLVQNKVSTRLEASIYGLVRIALLLLPAYLLGSFYRMVLRKK